jgi:hypothetical protein
MKILGLILMAPFSICVAGYLAYLFIECMIEMTWAFRLIAIAFLSFIAGIIVLSAIV